MTTPSLPGGPEPTRPRSLSADEEPLPLSADGGTPPVPVAPSDDETPLIRLTGESPAPAGRAFAASFARRHYFFGARLLRPGRRVAIALAGVTGLAVVGAGAVAGIARLGRDDTAAAATVQAGDDTPSPSAHASSGRPAHSSQRPSAKAKDKGHSSSQNDGSSTQGAGAQLPPAAAAPGAGGGSAGGGSGAQSSGSGTTGSGTQSKPAPPKTTTTGGFTGKLLFNFASSRCLATQSGSRAAGTEAVLADCNTSDPSQGWTFPSDGTIRDFGGTMCLDVSSLGNGTPVRLANCSSSRASHQRLVLKGSYDIVVNANPDLCVDAKDKNTAAGTVLQLWTCAGTANQKWRTA